MHTDQGLHVVTTAERIEEWITPLPRQVWVQISDLHDGPDGLDIEVAYGPGEETRALVRFERWVAYTNVDESYRLRTWARHDLKALGSMLIVRESRWLAYLVEESGGGIFEPQKVIHYAIYTGDDCIDVAAMIPPTITLSARA